MKKAEIFSLLSLPCFRLVGDEYVFGNLECRENQVRFLERDSIFSISFYKIENIELRTIDDQKQIIFLTHVGLIIFYFYDDTPESHIRYIHDAILGAFVAYKEQSYIHPIWCGSLSTWNQGAASIRVYSSKFVIQTGKNIYTYCQESTHQWSCTKYAIHISSDKQKYTLHCPNISLVQVLIYALQDGPIQGVWKSTAFLSLTHQYLIVSNKYLYIHTCSWKSKSTIQIELCHIHTAKHTTRGIELESLTHPIARFPLMPNQSHVFHSICSTIVHQPHREHIYLWRKNTLLRGAMIETKQQLIIETQHKRFQWSWSSLCRDDEDSRPQILALRNEEESIRIHLPKGFSRQDFYNKHTLPHRRIAWKELSPSAKKRIFTSRVVHIEAPEHVIQIVANMERKGSFFQVHPISTFSLQESELKVLVTFHTDHGQYCFHSLLIQSNGQLFITTPDQIALTSQRYAPRYKTNKKVIFSLLSMDQKTNRLSSSDEICIAHLINISEGGAGIVTSVALSISQKILLDIDDYPQQIICIVRHCTLQSNTEYKIGLQFCSLSNQSRKNINEMLQIFVKERN